MSDLEENAERIRHTTLPCGCIGTDHGLEGYVVEGGHICDGTLLAAQREARIEQRVEQAEEADKRHSAPLNGVRGFNLLR